MLLRYGVARGPSWNRIGRDKLGRFRRVVQVPHGSDPRRATIRTCERTIDNVYDSCPGPALPTNVIRFGVRSQRFRERLPRICGKPEPRKERGFVPSDLVREIQQVLGHLRRRNLASLGVRQPQRMSPFRRVRACDSIITYLSTAGRRTGNVWIDRSVAFECRRCRRPEARRRGAELGPPGWSTRRIAPI